MLAVSECAVLGACARVDSPGNGVASVSLAAAAMTVREATAAVGSCALWLTTDAGRIAPRLAAQRDAIERRLAAAAVHDDAPWAELEGAMLDAMVHAFDQVGPAFDAYPVRAAPILAWQAEEQLAEHSHPALVDGCWYWLRLPRTACPEVFESRELLWSEARAAGEGAPDEASGARQVHPMSLVLGEPAAEDVVPWEWLVVGGCRPPRVGAPAFVQQVRVR